MTVLKVDNLRVGLGGRLILDDITLQVDAGEMVGLIGPNGAGKTTLLRTVLGLIKRQSGQVLVNDRPRRPRGSAVGYVPQRHEFAWDFPVSVERAVMTGRTAKMGLLRRPGVADWQAVNDALARVDMAHLRNCPVGELSGGQRQRVLVARALALQPAVLLLDEPFTGLDMPTQEALTALFADLARENRAVLMTTHDLVGAQFACHRLVLLNKTVIASGTPAQLTDPQPWMTTFSVSASSPLLKALGLNISEMPA